MKPIYAPIVEQSERYLVTHGGGNLGVGWPSEDSAETHYRVISEIIPHSALPVSVLDFGCGLGGLFEHLVREGRTEVQYTGLDVSDSFLAAFAERYPDIPLLKLDVLADPESLPTFDYILANGIFTQKCELDHAGMWSYMRDVLRCLWPRCRRGLAFNMMSKHLDWEREDLFHLSMDDLAHFLHSEITRRFTLRHDYGYYDFTAYVYR